MPIGNKHIYIVDDDESICRSLELLLMTYGFEVSAFLSAEDFFNAVPNSVQGCLILDIHMPGLDGWEALKRIIKSGSNRPVIIITANKNGANNERAIKAGAVGYLQKPFTDQELVGLIRVALKKQEQVPLSLIVQDDKNED